MDLNTDLASVRLDRKPATMRRLHLVLLLVVCSFCSAQAALLAQSPGLQRMSSSTAKTFDHLVQEKLYTELQRELPGSDLTITERAYFEGIVADRTNNVLHAIALFEKVLPELKAIDTHRAAMALRTLADDYFETGRYAEAADTCLELLKGYKVEFSPADAQRISDDLHTYELLRGAAPQSVTGPRDFILPTRRDPIGDIEIPLIVGKTEQWWIFDTGASISTIPLSTAKRLGLTLSKGQASTQSGATGVEIPLRAAVIPEVRLGGSVVRNVVALVTEDKALDIKLGKKGHYAIQGILGYPILAALGSSTFSGDGLTVAAAGASSPGCTTMFIEQLTPLITATVNGRSLLFSFDTGARSSSFTLNYLREFAQQFSSLKAKRIRASGAGGTRSMHAYHLRHVNLQVGAATVNLRDVPVLTQELGLGLLDEVYGSLGQDLVGQFKSYTIDFSHMQLCVK